MQAFVPSIPLFVSIVIAISIIVYIIGHILYSILNENNSNNYERLFKKMVIGVISCTVLYSTFKTHFNTIFAGIWLISVFYFYWKKDQFNGSFFKNFIKVEWQPIMVYLPILVIFFLFFFFKVISFDFQPREEFLDEPYYAGIADYFNNFGIETTSLNSIDVLNQSPSFYNHFNQWMTALISSVFKMPSLIIYKFIIFPILYAIAFLGGISLTFRFFKKNILIHCCLALSFFFLLGLGEQINNLINQPNYGIFWDANIFLKQYSKLAIGTVLIIFSVLNFEKEFPEKFIFPLLILSLIYITFAPAIMGGILCYLFYTYFFNKHKHIRSILLLMLTVSYICFFYIYNKFISSYQFETYNSWNLFLDYKKTELFKFKTYVVTTWGYAKAFILSSFIYSILLFTDGKRFKSISKLNSSILCFLLGFMFSGFIMLLILKHTYDGHQFFSNPTLIIYIILLFSLICWVLSNLTKLDLIILLVITIQIVYSCYNNFIKQKDWNIQSQMSSDFLNKIVTEFKNKDFSSVYLRNPINTSMGQLKFNHLINIPVPQIRSLTTHYFPIPLSIFDLQNFENLAQKDAFLRTRTNTPFYNYVRTHHLEYQIESAKMNFIKSYKIDYLFVEKGNEWYKALGIQLPVEKILEDEKESFIIVKLDWKKT